MYYTRKALWGESFIENIYCAEKSFKYAEKTIITRRKHLYVNKHVLHKENIIYYTEKHLCFYRFTEWRVGMTFTYS